MNAPAARTELQQLLQSVLEHGGAAHKRDIAALVDGLRQGYRAPALEGHANGDDCAVLPTPNGYQLFAMEGFISEFVQADPWFAGWCGVMVNVSDITAMGGRASAVVNALWSEGDGAARELVAGMAAASRAYEVPIVGGHTNLRSKGAQLAVAITGWAQSLLPAAAAAPGETLVMAVDLRGAYRAPYLNWNAATEAPPARLRGDLALLPQLAEAGLASAAKDISQAGALGTLVMLLEAAGCGAQVDLDRLPKPPAVPWRDWLCSFPSFGYLLSVPAAAVPEVLARFHARDLAAAAIGELTGEHRRLQVNRKSESAVFWDLDAAPLTGWGPRAESSNIQSR